MNKYFFYLLLFSAVVITSCSKDDMEDSTPNPTENTCDTDNVTFSTFVKSKLSGSCASAGCHVGASGAAGFDFSSYADVKSAADSGRLFGAISHGAGFSPMPKGGGKMDACTINKIKSWIDDGALNN